MGIPVSSGLGSHLRLEVPFPVDGVVGRIHFLAAIEFMAACVCKASIPELWTIFERACLVRSGPPRIIAYLINLKGTGYRP